MTTCTPICAPSGSAEDVGDGVSQTALSRAEAAIALRRFEEAERSAREAIVTDGRDPSAFALLTRALLGQGRLTDAQRAAEDGLGVSPDSEWLHRLRALSLYRQKKHREALVSAERALELAPHLALCHYSCALALSGLKKRTAARAAMDRALELDPDDAELHRFRGDLDLDDDPKRAEPFYRAALRLNPQDPLALNNLGVALLRQKKHGDAAAAFKSAMLLDPSLSVARRNTHLAVGNLMRGGPTLGVIAFVFIQLLRAGAHGASGLTGTAETALAIAGVVGTVLGVAAIIFVSRWRRSKRQKEIAAQDPQLLAIYQKLENDRRQGRL